MRYVLGFVCVLALGLMGCSETSGTDGALTDCTGVENGTACASPDDVDGICVDGLCSVTDCTDVEDQTACSIGEHPEDWPGFCRERRCMVDCEDSGQGWAPCDADGADGACYFGICHVPDCSEAEPGTRCATGTGDAVETGGCEAGECNPQDCTGVTGSLPPCTLENDVTRPAFCIEEACVPADCEGLQDGTECLWVSTRAAAPGECEAGECVIP